MVTNPITLLRISTFVEITHTTCSLNANSVRLNNAAIQTGLSAVTASVTTLLKIFTSIDNATVAYVAIIDTVPTNINDRPMPDYKTLLSSDRKYRYVLWRDAREFDRNLLPAAPMAPEFKDSYLMFIGLNPSTADEKIDDNTIRVCRGYAKAWGYSHLCMTNLYAYRETNAHAMFLAPDDPIGAENDFHLLDCAMSAGLIIACWGAWAEGIRRARAVLKLLEDFPIHVLKLNNDDSPHHPLRMEKVLHPQLWKPATTSGSPAMIS